MRAGKRWRGWGWEESCTRRSEDEMVAETTGFEQRRRGGNVENSHLSCRNVLQAKIVARIRRGRTWRETWWTVGCRRQGCERIIKRTHQLLRHCHRRHSVDSFTVFPWRISFFLNVKSRDFKLWSIFFFLLRQFEKLNILKSLLSE